MIPSKAHTWRPVGGHFPIEGGEIAPPAGLAIRVKLSSASIAILTSQQR